MELPLIDAHGLGFSYGKPVLEEFSLIVAPGRIVVVLGTNGAGKTTALSLLAGERRPARGTVTICGRVQTSAFARRRLFHLRETAMPPFHLSPLESLGFHRALYGLPRLPRPAVAAILAETGLEAHAKRRIQTLSKGLRRRAELAALLAVDPEVWLLDEPASGLDPLGLGMLRAMLDAARRRGRAVVLASHALRDAATIADALVVLRNGRTRYSGDRKTLLATLGARSYVVEGGDAGTDAALAAAAAQSGASLLGPELPESAIAKLLAEGVDGP